MKKLLLIGAIATSLLSDCEFTYDEYKISTNKNESMTKYKDETLCFKGYAKGFDRDNMDIQTKSEYFGKEVKTLYFKIFENANPEYVYKLANLKKGDYVEVECTVAKNNYRYFKNCKIISDIDLEESEENKNTVQKEKIVYVDKIVYKEKECPKCESTDNELKKITFESFKEEHN